MVANGESVCAVLITGTIGSGKTVVATALGELLSSRRIPNAVIDLDWLGWAELGRGQDLTIDGLIAGNLAAVMPNFAAAGIRHFILARSIVNDEQVEGIRHALDDAELTVVRLTASMQTISARLRARDEGETLVEHLTQAEQFASLQNDGSVAAVDVSNDSRSITEVAAEVLDRLGWIR